VKYTEILEKNKIEREEINRKQLIRSGVETYLTEYLLKERSEYQAAGASVAFFPLLPGLELPKEPWKIFPFLVRLSPFPILVGFLI
jgi:hypothetical protein